jgi:medium-chain acyl-[acyl-carrier-protein] hydrolase
MSWSKLFKTTYNSTVRLFCFHYGRGSASAFQQWIKDLLPAAELIAIQLPGREDRFNEPLLSDISFIVVNWQATLKITLDKLFIFFGHSIGAIIAFEFVRCL